jgi:mannosyltransferase
VKDRSTFVVLILLGLITLLALGMRLFGLDAQSLWYDEGFSVYLARMNLSEITARTAADIQPPLYYYLLHGWTRILGDGEKALRGLSVLFGVLTVPLIYAVAVCLFAPTGSSLFQPGRSSQRAQIAGLLAALLVAVSPLHVWYGQEARMYTLLTFLCLLSSYLLLLTIPRTIGGERRWETVALWVAYTLTNIAALYTHYFAGFVLVFQGLYLFLVWWEQGLRPPRLILSGILSGVVAALAYLPWLPHLLTRFGTDTSYWPGQLNLPEVLLDIAISFTGGESVFESVGSVLAIGYALVFIVCLISLILQAMRSMHAPAPTPRFPESDIHYPLPSTQYPLAFLLLYLFIPLILILLLSYNSPKFNPRYVMVSHPALVLIVAGGLATLLQKGASRPGDAIRWILAGLALAYVLGVSLYASYSVYANPAFARADFRGVARYIQRNIAADESVILTSGHMFPVFDYYAPGVERHLLPDSPTLDATHSLDFSIAKDLNDWLADRGGVWVVRWQDEVVDPAGYLATMLGEAGEEQTVKREFSRVGLQHYRLPAGTIFSEQPSIDHRTNYNFGDQLQLLGYSQTGDRQVTLFWQALQPLSQDYRVSLILRDTMGQDWGGWDGRPAAYYFPTDRWREGQIVFGRYDLNPIPGTPPGEYGLEVGVYTETNPEGLDLVDQSGAPQGKRAMLGGVRLGAGATTPDKAEIPHPGRIDLGGGLTLLGWDLDREEVQPGDRALLTLVWSVESQPQGDYQLHLTVTDSEGQMLDAGTFPPTNVWHPTSTWQEGQTWRGQATFRLPIETQPGEARLSLRLASADGTALNSPAELTSVKVMTTDRVFSAPQPQRAGHANFADKIALLGADLVPGTLRPGDTLSVTLYWQVLTEMDIPYTVFVHLLASDGRVVAGHDSEPVGGARPTTSWVPGEFITDLHTLPTPADLSPGEYLVEIGLYDAGVPGLPRLPVLGEEGQVKADRVVFGPVLVR